MEYQNLFSVDEDVEVVETGPTVRVILGRGDSAQMEEFPYSDLGLPEGPMVIPDDRLLEAIERHMGDVVRPGQLRDRKVSRPAEGNVILVGAESTYG